MYIYLYDVRVPKKTDDDSLAHRSTRRSRLLLLLLLLLVVVFRYISCTNTHRHIAKVIFSFYLLSTQPRVQTVSKRTPIPTIWSEWVWKSFECGARRVEIIQNMMWCDVLLLANTFTIGRRQRIICQLFSVCFLIQEPLLFLWLSFLFSGAVYNFLFVLFVDCCCC